MPLYWLVYRLNNQISVVIEPAHSLIYARLRAAIDGLDEGEFTEGPELPGKWKVAKEMIGRRLSQGGSEEVVGEVGIRAVPDYEEFIGAKKHLVLRLLSQNGPQGSKSFAAILGRRSDRDRLQLEQRQGFLAVVETDAHDDTRSTADNGDALRADGAGTTARSRSRLTSRKTSAAASPSPAR